jgi:hypothetical protein
MEKIKDGIVDTSKYGINGMPKIMWVLKEGNVSEEDKEISIDLCEGLRTDWHKKNALAIPTFRKMIYATYCILNPDTDWSDVPYANAEAYEAIKYIAYININKYPAGSVSNYNDIQKAYDDNKEELLNQIFECNPNIIIFGNTLQYFKVEDMKRIGFDISNSIKKYADDSTKNTSFFIASSDKLCVHAYHPSYPKLSNKIYSLEIKTAVQKWKQI